MRYLTGVMMLVALGAACSRGPEPTVAAAPTSPSVAGSSSLLTGSIGGVSGKMDVLFPGRNESFQFRNDLETKYQTGLSRAPSLSYVDREGEVVWTQEYMRYRVNGCDHLTAMARILTQIDGGAAGGICAAPPDGAVIFPSRAESLAFRRELEFKYQQMGRALSQSFVDLEGGVIWTQEYLRYRANACDHATGEAKVFSQIDGGPVPATCFVPCSYVLGPGNMDLGSSASTQAFEVRPNPTACGYRAESDASWLTFNSDLREGSGFLSAFTFSVSQNNGSGRTGHITFTWSGGSARFTVFQAGTPFNAGFTLVDPFRSPGTTTECHFRSTATPCNFTAFANLPGATYTYVWSATYVNGTSKTQSLTTTASANFSFSDQCGATGSTATGDPGELSVSLTITDNLGNTITLRSGQGNQPALSIVKFSC